MLDRVQGLVDAAKKAYDNYDYEGAFQLYWVAIDILRQQNRTPLVDDMMIQTYKDIIKTLSKGDQWFMAMEYADRLLEEAREKRDKKLELEAHLLACGVLLNHNNWIEGKKRYTATLELAKRSGDNLAIAECYYGLAYIDCRTGNVKGAAAKTKEALDILEGEEPSLLLCKTIIECGSIDDTAGNSSQAIESFRLAIETLRNFPPNEELARAYNNIGEVYKNMGDYTSAAKEYQCCVEAARQAKFQRAVIYGLSNIAECYALSGRVSDAKKALNEVEEMLMTTHEKYLMAKLPFIRGIISHAEKDYGAAVEYYDYCARRMRILGELPYDLGLVNYHKGLALKDLGKDDHAAEAFRESKMHFEKADAKLFLKKLAEHYD